jgi:adenine phosphoribosyltransferase
VPGDHEVASDAFMPGDSAAPDSAAEPESVATPGNAATILRARIRDIPDYPQPGIIFKDITPLLADGPAFAAVVDALADGNADVTKVAGIEARGFILAAPVAYVLGAGFVPVRKQGKLPAETYAESYELEYGKATIEVHSDGFGPGDRVLIVDDVLATGGTAAATAELVRRAKLPGLDVRSLLAV